jgi:hypothetical protein
MENLSIPIEHTEIFQFYFGLPRELKSKIIDILKSAEVGLSPNHYSKRLVEEIPLSKNRANDIMSIYFNLSNAKVTFNLDDKDFLNLLINSLKEVEEVEDKEYLPNVIATEMLEMINSCGLNLFITYRAIGILNDNQRLFLDFNITNDIRPVFVYDENKGFVIIHNLKFEYRESDKNKEIFFALDSEDLKKLKEGIDKSEKQLSILNDSSKLNIIEFK